MNDNTEEVVNINATIEVNSSINEFSALSVICNEVIINKQKPSKLAAVPKICCDVLFAIFYFFSMKQKFKINWICIKLNRPDQFGKIDLAFYC